MNTDCGAESGSNNDSHNNTEVYNNTCNEVRHVLSSSASLFFWMTGVTNVSSVQLCSTTAEKGESNDDAEGKKQQKLPLQDDSGEMDVACDTGIKSKPHSTPAFGTPQNVIWVQDTRVKKKNTPHNHNGVNGNSSNTSIGGGISSSSSSSSSSSGSSGIGVNHKHYSTGKTNTTPTGNTPVHITDETVMCNLVPMLPRTHAEYALVSQIVPCTVWPPLTPDIDGKPPVSTLQETAALASQLHEDSLRGSSTPPPFFAPAALPGALVEWVTGSVGYTADTEGLWEEQRIVTERYYRLLPVPPEEEKEETEKQEETEKKQYMVLPKVIPRLPPSTVRGAVIEQLRRFRGVQENRRRLGEKRDHWMPLFARLVELTYTCVATMDEIVRKLSAGVVSRSSECDSMLDEVLLIGIVPRGDPHRLSLLCPSEAYRVLTEDQRQEEDKEEQEKQPHVNSLRGSIIAGDITNSEPTCGVAERLLELILRSLRDTLQRRIGVQYELLRILRVRAVAVAHRDMLNQYTRWYATVPTPLAVLHLLSGSTLFGPLMAERSSHKPLETRQMSSLVVCGGGIKRRREGDNGEGQKNEVSNEQYTEEMGDDADEEEEEEGGPASPSTLRDGMSSGISVLPPSPHLDGNRVGSKSVVRVPYEADLLDDDYMTRFAAWLRSNATNNNNSNDNSNYSSNHHNKSSGGGGNGSGSVINASSGSCDEVALTTTIGWLRRRKRTMTLKELDAFARKQP